MAKNFELYKNTAVYETETLEKDSATVIKAGKFVTLDGAGLAIEADDTSTAIAYCEGWAIAGDTTCIVSATVNMKLSGTAATAFADANRWAFVDMSISGSDQLINLAASATGVFQVLPGEDAGIAGETTNVRVRIAKTL